MINAGGNVSLEVVLKDLFKHSAVYSSVESSLVLTIVKPIKIFLDEQYYYPGSTVKTISILGFSRVRWTESSVYMQYTYYLPKYREIYGTRLRPVVYREIFNWISSSWNTQFLFQLSTSI